MTSWAHDKSVKRTGHLFVAVIWAACMLAYWWGPAAFAGIISYIAARALMETIKLEVEVFPPEK